MEKKKAIVLILLILFSQPALAIDPYLAAWSTQLLTAANNTGLENAIVVTSDFNKHISFGDVTADEIGYCTDSSGAWVCESIAATGGYSRYSDITGNQLDSNVSITSGDASTTSLRYCDGNAGNWTCEEIEAEGGGGTSIIYGSGANYHISHLDNAIALRYCTGTIGNWTCEQVDTTGQPEDYSSIVQSMDGNLNIAFHDDAFPHGNDDLRFCTGTIGSWTCEAVASETGFANSGTNAKIVYADQNLHIVHNAGSNTRHCMGDFNNWTCENVIISTGSLDLTVGDNNVLALVRSNTYCQGKFGNWTCRVFDGNITSVIGNGIAYQSDNNTMHVSFRDNTLTSLNYSQSLTNNGLTADFDTTIHTESFDADAIVNNILVDLNSTTTVIDVNITGYQWFLDGLQISTDQNVQRNFITGSNYNASLIVTGIQTDTNFTVTSQHDENINLNVPVITSYDFNVDSNISLNTIGQIGNVSMQCTIDDATADLNYLVTVNDVNVYDSTVDDNFYLHLTDQNFIDGTNTITYYCTNLSGIATSYTIEFGAYLKNFYFVFDNTGAVLSDSTEYDLGDVNSVYVYNFDNNAILDLYGDSEVSFYASGDENTALQIRIGYNDITFPFISRDFHLSVLDTNSVPVCYSYLQTFYENALYSSIDRELILKNASTGCYQIAAKTKYAYGDSLSISGFLIPQSYNLYLVESGVKTLLAVVDGSSAGSINIDALVLKKEFAQELNISYEGATITKNCGGTATDCNTWTIVYKNTGENNSKVVVTVLNGSSAQFTYTETSTPNEFDVTFSAADLNFNAELLTLRVIATRTNGTTKNFLVYFTPTGQVGYINPFVALILSFIIFLGGITLVSTRLVFGWFGAIIALVGLALLSFSVGAWYIVFMQGIMLVMLVYIGMTHYKNTLGAV